MKGQELYIVMRPVGTWEAEVDGSKERSQSGLDLVSKGLGRKGEGRKKKGSKNRPVQMVLTHAVGLPQSHQDPVPFFAEPVTSGIFRN